MRERPRGTGGGGVLVHGHRFTLKAVGAVGGP